MTIDQEIYQAFLQCPTKAYLLAHRGTDESSFTEPDLMEDAYRREGTAKLLRGFDAEQTTPGGVITSESLQKHTHRLFCDCQIVTEHLDARLHALRSPQATKHKDDGGQIPIRFTLSEKVSNDDKFMLAFDALALSELAGKGPQVGENVHGHDYRTTRVPLMKIYPKLRSALKSLDQQVTSLSAPTLVLNKHCPNCRYMARCRQMAKEADDLSLLAKMSEKERDHYHRKGIFTVTQLSHTFRPRRRGRSNRGRGRRRSTGGEVTRLRILPYD